MPALGLQTLKQRAVLWPVNGFDEFGQFTVSDTPFEIKCAWNDVFQQTLDSDKNTITIEAVVMVDRDVAIGSVMWFGSLADWPGDAKPASGIGAAPYQLLEVKFFNSVPDIKRRGSVKVAKLVRFRNTLPNKSITNQE